MTAAAGGSMGALLDAPVPDVTVGEAEAIADRLFGLRGVAHPLTGERDRNFRLQTEDGARYALRVINPAEDGLVSDFQSRALEHLAAKTPHLPVPRLHRPLAGDGCEAVWDGGHGAACRVRVLDYLPGRPLHLTVSGDVQRRAIGRCLAQLDAGLDGFRHPGEDHRLLWDIQHAASLRDLAAYMSDEADRRLVHAVLDRFQAHAEPALATLPRQVIHNDFNPHNVLAHAEHDDRIAGIIDFGDMVRAPRVQDVATAAAYQIDAREHPLHGPCALAAAYHAVRPLLAAELAVLADLVATRLVTTVLISGLRAQRQPGNAAYILRNFPRSIAGLRRFAAVPRADAHSMLLERLAA